MAPRGESVSSYCDRFIAYMRGLPNHHIVVESLEEYFYRAKDDNIKVVLDTIVACSSSECTYAEIAEKLGKIPRKNKTCTTRKSNTGRNTF